MLRINSGSGTNQVENQLTVPLTQDSPIQRTPEAFKPSMEELEQARETAQARKNESVIEASVRKVQVDTKFLEEDDPKKTAGHGRNKKPETPNVPLEQAKEAGKQVMGALAPEGMDVGANIAEGLVEVSASAIPGKLISNTLTDIMFSNDVDGATQKEAERLLTSFNNEVKTGNVAEGLQWQQKHGKEFKDLLQRAKAQGYETEVRPW